MSTKPVLSDEMLTFAEKIGPDLLPLFSLLAATVRHQDRVYGGFADDIASVRLAVAVLEDETREVRDAWRAERRTDGWPETGVEAIQTAAVAMRLLRDSKAAGRVAREEEAATL